VTGCDVAGALVAGALVTGCDVAGALVAGALVAGWEFAGADVAGAVVGTEVACAVGALVGCDEPTEAKGCGALVGGALPELPLIERFLCNQAIWSSVSAIASAP
jgi:hypothetical protein